MTLTEESLMHTVQDSLRCFGITKRYTGYLHLVYCIQLVIADDFRLAAVTKEIYMEAAAYFDCKWTRIERNIRTLAAVAWQLNADLLIQMAGYPLSNAPTTSEFIEILASYFLRSMRNTTA